MRFLATFLLTFCKKKISSKAGRKNKEIQHFGHKNHPLCHAKINSNCIHKGKKNCLGRRKVRHFCITTTSQIIGAAATAPAALLSTPLNVLLKMLHL